MTSLDNGLVLPNFRCRVIPTVYIPPLMLISDGSSALEMVVISKIVEANSR